MTTLNELFELKVKQIKQFSDECIDIICKINTLQTNRPDIEQELTLLGARLKTATEKFEHGLKQPQITLATTGTTSSGKSSLVNLLCGAELAPVAVEEASAGILKIVHAKQVFLKIPVIQGIAEEESGEWFDLSPAEIRKRLAKVMQHYLQLRKDDPTLLAPHFELHYPTYLGNNAEKFGFPENFQLRILDLPGLKYTRDIHTAEIIRQETSQALCLVAYNSEETDDLKQQELLFQVTEQVKALRGGPARMLFILSRIDAFLRDEDAENRVEKYVKELNDKIRSHLRGAMREYTSDIEAIEICKLSPKPALYAHLSLSDDRDISCNARQEINKNYAFLIEDIVEELPRRVDHWTLPEVEKVAAAVNKVSYTDEFKGILQKHIEQHLPKLLFSDLAISLRDTAIDVVNSLDAVIHAELNSTQSRYASETQRLQSVMQQLHVIHEETGKKLMTMMVIPDESTDIKGAVYDITQKAHEMYSITEDKLAPFYLWFDEFNHATDYVLLKLKEAVAQGQTILSDPEHRLPSEQHKALQKSLAQLHDLNYLNSAGTYIKTAEQAEKERLTQMKIVMDVLFLDIVALLKAVFEREANHQADRIMQTFYTLLDAHTDELLQQTRHVAPDLSAINTKIPCRIMKISHKPYPKCEEFKHIFLINEETKKELTWKGFVEWLTTDSGEFWEEKKYRSSEIPVLDKVIERFMVGLQNCKRHAEQEFANWLHETLKTALSSIQHYQENLINEYQAKLDQAMQEYTTTMGSTVDLWESMAERLSVVKAQLPHLDNSESNLDQK